MGREVVAKVVFLELWRETVAGCLNGPSSGHPPQPPCLRQTRLGLGFRAGQEHS